MNNPLFFYLSIFAMRVRELWIWEVRNLPCEIKFLKHVAV